MARFRNVARRELVFLALGAMDVCVVTPLLASFLYIIMPSVNLLGLVLLFFCAIVAVHYLARAGLQLPLRPAGRIFLAVLLMLASGLFITHRLGHVQTTSLWDATWLLESLYSFYQAKLSPDLIVFLTVLFIWWRGLALAQRRLDSESVAFRFRLGVVTLAVTVAVGGLILPWPMYRFVFAFFPISLLGIALARAEEVEQQYGGGQSPFSLSWLAVLVVASLIVLLLAMGAAALLTGESVTRILRPIWDVVSVILAALFYALSWVVYGLVYVFLVLWRFILKRVNLKGFQDLELPSLPQFPEQQPPFSPDQAATFKVFAIIGMILFLLAAIAFSLRRLRTQAGQQLNDERESVWEGGQLGRSLRDALRRGRDRLDDLAAALGRSPLGNLWAALTIRRIYARLGALAAERGYPRAPHETPYEYRPTLASAFPENRAEIERITEAYVAVHYGQIPERQLGLESVQAAWERIRSAPDV